MRVRCGWWAGVGGVMLAGRVVLGALPGVVPADGWFEWRLAYGPEVPGEFSAAGLVQGLSGGEAGAEGFVEARGGHFFVGTGEKARRIRFLGVNLCYGADFPSHEKADALAERLARFGVNIVRFHHMDSQAYPGGIFADRSLTRLSPAALDRLDYLIAALKKNGVYTDLNLHVSRSDAVAQGMENAAQAPAMDKQIDIFDPALVASQKTYARDLLTHVNAYTHKAYAEEPAVAMVEINNENTLFMWGAEQNLQNLPENFAGELRGLWNEWLTKKYGTREALAAAWGTERGGLAGDESLGDKTVRMKQRNVMMTGARAQDWYDFLQGVDRGYFEDMYKYVKETLGVQAPVTGTIGLGALGTMTQAETDFVDAHQYWQHPVFPGNGAWSTVNYRVENTPMVDSPGLGVFPALAAIRVAGKPFTVTEYDEPAPGDWRTEALPLLASVAALQDWDAVFVFAYSHSATFERDHADSFFDLAADAGQLDLMPAAARIFLSGAVKPLPAGEPVYVSREEALGRAGRDYFNLWNELRGVHGLGADVLLREQLRVSFTPGEGGGASMERAAGPAVDGRVAWERGGPGTGEFRLNDPRAGVFVGFPKAGERVALGPVVLEDFHTPFVVATVTTPEMGEELSSARRLLVTVEGRTENVGMAWNAEHTSVSTHWGTGPGELEKIGATMRVPEGYRVRRLDAAGKAEGEAMTGEVRLEEAGTMWFLVER